MTFDADDMARAYGMGWESGLSLGLLLCFFSTIVLSMAAF